MNINDIWSRFELEPKVIWAPIEVDEVRIRLERLETEMRLHQTEKREAHDLLKPDTADTVAVQEQWKQDGREMEERQTREVSDFQSMARIRNNQASTLPDQYARYGERYKATKDAYTDEFETIRPQVEALLAEELADTERLTACESRWKEVVRRLRNVGVNEDLCNTLEGWEAALQRAYLRNACARQGVDADQNPQRLPFPAKPGPIPVTVPTTYTDKLSFADIIMGLVGAIIGISASGLCEGVIFDSKGFHVTFVFYIVFSVAMVLSFTAGKALIPNLLSSAQLQDVDLYPYLKTAEQDVERAKVKRNADWARKGLAAFLCAQAAIDIAGWVRMVVERNSAVQGDVGATIYGPLMIAVIAMVMAILSTLGSCIKIASVSTVLKKMRKAIDEEVKKNQVAYENLMRTFAVQEADYQNREGYIRAYYGKLDEAKRTAQYNMSGEEANRVRQMVGIFQEECSPNEQAFSYAERIEAVIEPALDKLYPLYQALLALENEISRTWNEVASVLA